MRLKTALVALSICLASLAPRRSFADTVTFQSSPIGPIDDGNFVYPYDFTVAGAGGTESDVALACLDYQSIISVGETWAVDVYSVASIGSGGLGDGSQQELIEDAWLYNEFAGGLYSDGDIQYALWYIWILGTWPAWMATPPERRRPWSWTPKTPTPAETSASMPTISCSLPTPAVAPPGLTVSRNS